MKELIKELNHALYRAQNKLDFSKDGRVHTKYLFDRFSENRLIRSPLGIAYDDYKKAVFALVDALEGVE